MSEAMKQLQLKIGATADGEFGPNTLKLAAKHFRLTNEQAAHMFGQCSHESGHFTVFSENLNYSAKGLLGTFKKYFPTSALAEQYARKPEKIANRVYANRMGNGNEASGDGWKFRGRSALQTTGHDNYALLAEHLNDPQVMVNPDIVASKYAFDAAKFFFDHNNLWALCATVTDASILAVTKRVNGGTNGLAERVELTKKYYGWLKK
jgi:putative chitinase